MTDKTFPAAIRQLRDCVADLETAHRTPLKVEIEGFEGVRQLNHAIETQQLDRFALQNATPDRVFWGWFWALMVAVVLALAIGIVQNALG